MQKQELMSEKKFEEFEKQVLKQVMETSKAVLESHRFRAFYGIKVTPELNDKTLKGLKDFRAKNWDNSVSKEEAYKKYLRLY